MASALSRWTDRALASVERVGNRLPDPITLFVLFMVIVLVASWIAAGVGLSATHPGTGEEIRALNLLTAEGIQRILTEMPRTFTDFPPLGLVLVVMLGIGVAERTGLVETALKAFLGGIAGWLVTAAIVLAGILSSVAVDAGYVVLIPLGAVIFHGMGRHPIAGLAAAFAGVSGGFSANLSLTALDPLLAGFTQPAARLVGEAYVVDPTANWWLMIALVPVYVVSATLVTERVLEPRLGKYTGTVVDDREGSGGARDGADGPTEPGASAEPGAPLSDVERKGLVWAGATFAACLVLIVWLALPEPGILRSPDGEITPLLSSIVALMLFVFFLPGLVYGLVTGSIRSDKDVAKMTSDTMGSMGAYIVLAFAAAHFIAFFNWSNLGLILAVSGAGFLQVIDFTGVPLIVAFVLVSSFINLFIGSASAKWAIMGSARWCRPCCPSRSCSGFSGSRSW